MPCYRADDLKRLTVEIFRREGVPEDEVEILSNHLIKANLAGMDSHGVMRIPQYIEVMRTGTFRGRPFQKIVPGAKYEIDKDNGSTLLVNGNCGFGQVTAWRSMNLSIDRARQYGISAVCSYNTSHIGRLGEYTTLAANKGMVGIVLCNIGRMVAPFGGAERMLGTNPISVGIPSGKYDPFILDMATTVQAEGKIRYKYMSGKELPIGLIIDKQGKPTRNPGDLYEGGAILTFGGEYGYKGYGLSLMIEMLGGLLTGTMFGSHPDYVLGGSGTVTIALEIERFVKLEVFKAGVDQLIENIKSSKKQEGYDEILIPGEPEFRNIEKREKEGIELSNAVIDSIKDVAASLDIHLEEFLTELH